MAQGLVGAHSCQRQTPGESYNSLDNNKGLRGTKTHPSGVERVRVTADITRRSMAMTRRYACIATELCYIQAERLTRLEWEGYDQVALRVVHEASA